MVLHRIPKLISKAVRHQSRRLSHPSLPAPPSLSRQPPPHPLQLWLPPQWAPLILLVLMQLLLLPVAMWLAVIWLMPRLITLML